MSENPYTSPKSDISSIKTHSPFVTIGSVIALLLFAFSVRGLMMGVFRMIDAFATLAESGQADPAELAGEISTAILITLWGWIISLVGFILILIYHHKIKYRKKWFFLCATIIAAISLLFFPLGTITGGVVLWTMIKNRSSYITANQS